MRILSLASSSLGNCYIIDDTETKIMIECGIPYNRMRKEGVRFKDLSGCLISHEHRDHSFAWEDVIKYIPIYTSKGTYSNLKRKNFFIPSNKVNLVEKMKTFKIKTFEITPFETEHDANEPLGFYIHSNYTKENLLFATDTYYIKNKFYNLNYIMIECNYKREYLDCDTKIVEKVRNRLYTSHFELSNVIKFLQANDLTNVKEIYLLHLSASHSRDEEFKREIERTTGIPTIVCRK